MTEITPDGLAEESPNPHTPVDLTREIVSAGTTISKKDGKAIVLTEGVTITFTHCPETDSFMEEWTAQATDVDTIIEGTGQTKQEASDSLKRNLASTLLMGTGIASVNLSVELATLKDKLESVMRVDAVAGDETFPAGHMFWCVDAESGATRVFTLPCPKTISYRNDGSGKKNGWEAFTSGEGLAVAGSTSGNQNVVESGRGETKKEAHNALINNLVRWSQSFEAAADSELIDSMSLTPSRLLPAGYKFTSENVQGFTLKQPLIVHFEKDEDGFCASPQANLFVEVNGIGSTQDEAAQSLLEYISCRYQLLRAKVEAEGQVAASQELEWQSLQDFIEMDSAAEPG